MPGSTDLPVERQGSDAIRLAIEKLRSFRDSERGIEFVIACGKAAVPALRALVFEREPTGLYQARCRAVSALAALESKDVLIEFLAMERCIDDPIERLGEDAVINAVALAVADIRDRDVFELLLHLAKRPALTGVIGALGAFCSVEAIPVLVQALGEDASRVTAEIALRKLGDWPYDALLAVATARIPKDVPESETSVRFRCSALSLLSQMSPQLKMWPDLRCLLYDPDPRISVLVCEICLDRGDTTAWPEAVRRLIALLANESWLLRDKIETYLIAHIEKTRTIIDNYLRLEERSDDDRTNRGTVDAILQRVISTER